MGLFATFAVGRLKLNIKYMSHFKSQPLEKEKHSRSTAGERLTHLIYLAGIRNGTDLAIQIAVHEAKQNSYLKKFSDKELTEFAKKGQLTKMSKNSFTQVNKTTTARWLTTDKPAFDTVQLIHLKFLEVEHGLNLAFLSDPTAPERLDEAEPLAIIRKQLTTIAKVVADGIGMIAKNQAKDSENLNKIAEHMAKLTKENKELKAELKKMQVTA